MFGLRFKSTWPFITRKTMDVIADDIRPIHNGQGDIHWLAKVRATKIKRIKAMSDVVLEAQLAKHSNDAELGLNTDWFNMLNGEFMDRKIPFEGKGGENDGGGASGDWDRRVADDPDVIPGRQQGPDILMQSASHIVYDVPAILPEDKSVVTRTLSWGGGLMVEDTTIIANTANQAAVDTSRYSAPAEVHREPPSYSPPDTTPSYGTDSSGGCDSGGSSSD